MLLKAGKRIIDSNRRLSERLNRIIVGPEAERSRMLLEQIGDIKKMVLGLNAKLPEDEAFISAEADPDIYLPLERPLSLLQEETDFSYPEEPDIDSPDLTVLQKLFYIDYRELRRNIDELLINRTVVTLEQVLKGHPPQRGLAEIIAYRDIGSRDPHCEIRKDGFSLCYHYDETERTVRVPQVLYAKKDAGNE